MDHCAATKDDWQGLAALLFLFTSQPHKFVLDVFHFRDHRRWNRMCWQPRFEISQSPFQFGDTLCNLVTWQAVHGSPPLLCRLLLWADVQARLAWHRPDRCAGR